MTLEERFPIGCKVKLIAMRGFVAQSGATATVVGHNYLPSFVDRVDYFEFVDVVWDRNELFNNQKDGGYSSESFEVVK